MELEEGVEPTTYRLLVEIIGTTPISSWRSFQDMFFTPHPQGDCSAIELFQHVQDVYVTLVG